MTCQREFKWRPAVIWGSVSWSRFVRAGGDGGIRTLDRALQPYNGLANRRLQPLGHVSAHPENGALWMRSHMLAEVCPSTGAMAIPPHAAEPPVGTATALCPAWRPSVAPGCSLCALQQSHTPPKKGQPAKLRFTRPAPTLICDYAQEGD